MVSFIDVLSLFLIEMFKCTKKRMIMLDFFCLASGRCLTRRTRFTPWTEMSHYHFVYVFFFNRP